MELSLGGESNLAVLKPAGRVEEFAVREAVLSNKKFNSAAVYWAPVIARRGRREEACLYYLHFSCFAFSQMVPWSLGDS